MKIMIRISSVLLALVLLCGGLSAFAADSSVTFLGAKDGFATAPGSNYTATDLFDGFKDTMPGDKLSETVALRNQATDCDYIKLYLRAEVLDESGNPLTYDEAFESLDGKDQAGVEGVRDETVASMQDFLSQLTMRIYIGEDMIYNASPDEAGALVNNVYLATLDSGKEATLRVELDVPIELGNAYANRVGEVNWIFFAEAYENDALVQTGQLNWPIPVFCLLGVLLIVVGVLLMRKGKKEKA